LPAGRAGRRSPADGLALGRDVTTQRASRLAALARRLRLPVVVGLGVKDAFAQRARSLLTLGSLALAAVIVVCTLAFEATMDRLASDPALRAQPWDLLITPVDVTPAEGARLVRHALGTPLACAGDDCIASGAASSIAAVATVDELALVAPAGAIDVRARVLDGPLESFRFAVPDGRAIARAGEVTAGRSLLQALGARVGDRVGLAVRGTPFTVRIVGRHVEPEAGGRAVVIAAGSLPRSARPLLDDPDWALRLAPGADAVATAAAIERTGGGRLSVRRPVESLEREASELRPMVYGLSALLVAIGLANLLTTLLLGLRERERDLAIIGTVGATPRQVAGTVLAGGAALAVPAALLGVPAGAWLFGFLIARTDPSDGPDVATLPSPLLLALALPAALLVTAAVSVLAARQARAVDPARALRAE
jgi:putative ABC transport system permease protein